MKALNEPITDETVNLRTLNQQAGKIVRSVATTGKGVTVTDHNRPLARIEPISDEEPLLERLTKAGRVQPATRRHHIRLQKSPMPAGVTLQELLAEDRRED